MRKIIHSALHPIQAKLHIPGSKSISNRALLLAALAEGYSEISNIQISEDIRAMIKGLQTLGVAVELNEATQKAIVKGIKGQFSQQDTKVYCGESGTMARFILTACAANPGEYQFDAAPSLKKRPLASLLNILRDQEVCVHATAESFPLSLCSSQGLSGGEIIMEAKETGQVVSALLLLSPFMKTALQLKVEKLVSRSYVEMTCAMMAEFGVSVDKLSDSEFSVLQPQHYQARVYFVEPDASTASYFFAAAAVTAGEVSIPELQRKNSKQGDLFFLSLLEEMGCEVYEDARGLTLKGKSPLQGIDANLKDCPDLFMSLAAVAPVASSPTVVTGIAHVRHKESDRLSAMRKGLESLGVRVEEGADWFKIYPGQMKAAVISSQNDHRIAMAFSVLGLCVPGITIEGAECVSKSCPEFFQLWGRMVGEVA